MKEEGKTDKKERPISQAITKKKREPKRGLRGEKRIQKAQRSGEGAGTKREIIRARERKRVWRKSFRRTYIRKGGSNPDMGDTTKIRWGRRFS